MIASGAPVTEVQHRLGHANPAITLQVCSHFFKHIGSDAADRLASAVLGGLAAAAEISKSGHSVGTRGGRAVEPIAVSA
jgi:hypothetical protein